MTVVSFARCLLTNAASSVKLATSVIRSRRLCSTDVRVQPAIAKVAGLIASGKATNIVVLCGAGISTPSGVPDFRSPSTGLYDNLEQYDLPYPEAIFDLTYFRVNPKPFMMFAKALFPGAGQHRPNAAHYFICLLAAKGLLLRTYTQNIDGLERMSGLPPDLLVEAHGTFSSATCQQCRKPYTAAQIKADIFSDKIPVCQVSGCQGVVKPDVVFFGEQLPANFFRSDVDLPTSDLLLVIGTSLEVFPFADLVSVVKVGVPRVLFNREVTGQFLSSARTNDIVVTGDLLRNIMSLCELLNWTDEIHSLLAAPSHSAPQGSMQ